jgi:histidine triad (HIT) family protein
MLSDDEAEKVKQKLISHIESTFPPEQIFSAKNQIESMNSEELEIFLEKNKILASDESDNDNAEQCVFCAIASGKINSVKIGENEKAIAVLDINPISKGHSLIIPFEHKDVAPKEAIELAKKISKEIEKKFSPKKIEMSHSKLFGHEVINILPVYKDENFNSERTHASVEELEKVKEELEKVEEEKKETIVEKIKEFLWLPKRIP